MFKKIFRPQVITILAIIWFAFTFSLVTWWWIFFLVRLDPSKSTSLEQLAKSHRMFAWEGSILIASILFGGAAMIIFAYSDQKRHQRLSLFFSTFSHDIKTSIARLRLQAEVLDEEMQGHNPPVVRRLIDDIQRLDLQLENSLLIANLHDLPLYIEKMTLSSLVESLRIEFSELSVEIERDATFFGDRRSLISILKNTFQNSVVHGKASTIKIQVREQGSKQIELRISDNGQGYKGEIQKLGTEILKLKNPHSNGIGLLITTRLLKKMKGHIRYESQAGHGFVSILTLEGSLN